MLILGRDRLKDPERGYATHLPAPAGGVPRPRPRAGRADRHQRGRPQPGRTRRRRTGAGRTGSASPSASPTSRATTCTARAPRRPHRQRLPRRRRHRRLPARRGRRRRHRPGHRRRPGHRPAAAHFGWGPDDLRPLAGAVVAGHVLECGTQATGGNYAFFARARRAAAPASRSPRSTPTAPASSPSTPAPAASSTSARSPPSCCTRPAAPGTPAPTSPPASTPYGSPRTAPTGSGSTGVRGEAPPPTLKVGLNRLGGCRNEVVFVLTGLDIEAKAALVREQLADALGQVAARPRCAGTLARTDQPDADTEETASALLRLVVRDPDQDAVGRASQRGRHRAGARQLPGLPCDRRHPGRARPTGSSRPCTYRPGSVDHVAVLPRRPPDHRANRRPRHAATRRRSPNPPLPEPLPAGPDPPRPARARSPAPAAATRAATPTSASGCATDDAWRWLAHELTVDRFRDLLPETAG